MGSSFTFRGHLAQSKGAVALSEGTSLGHREIGSCVFS